MSHDEMMKQRKVFLDHVRQASADLKKGGSLEFELNLASWLGDRVPGLLKIIDELQAKVEELEKSWRERNEREEQRNNQRHKERSREYS